jgi:hypothetical protein
LGQICQRNSRRAQAIKYYKKSLELDSFLWGSYQALCQLGENVYANELFREDECEEEEVEQENEHEHDLEGLSPLMTPTPVRGSGGGVGGGAVPRQPDMNFVTPSPGGPILATPRGVKLGKPARPGVSSAFGSKLAQPVATPGSKRKSTVRRSGRLMFAPTGTGTGAAEVHHNDCNNYFIRKIVMILS